VVLFCYNHITLVKIINVIIFQCVRTFTFCAESSKLIVVYMGPYSWALCWISKAYADCGLSDVM